MTVPITDLARLHAPLESELKAAFGRVLDANAFILGTEVERFEQMFAELCGVRHCVGVASGTAALTIMIHAAGIEPGDEVIVPAHTFIASALAVRHAGAVPVCVDVERGSGLIDPDAVQAAVGPRTTAILAVHLYGQTSRMGALREIAQAHGLALLEDAAQAHGAMHIDERAGSLGTAAAFSFYPSKNLGALGDAGAICTDDEQLAHRARRWRDLGRGGDSVHALPGYNERLDGLQAALLAVKLPHVDGWTRQRRAIAREYEVRLGGQVELLQESDETPCTYHLFPIRVDARDDLAAHLAELGVATGVHYPIVVPDQPPFNDSGGAGTTPIARDWAARELSIPVFPGMTDSEIEIVVSGVAGWVAGNARSSRSDLRKAS
jgi:dTDP-3-amino-3,4,6-trideoxy-alpha-D-glucose transaminase